MQTIQHPGLKLACRPMLVTDLGEVLAIEKQCHSHPWSEKQFISSLESSHQCHVVFFEQQLVAHAVTSTAADEAELLTIAVSPDWQKKGIASVFLMFLMSQFDDSIHTLFLEVRVSNQAAIGLYHSLGFNEVGSRPNYYPAEGDKGREDALIMAAMLG